MCSIPLRFSDKNVVHISHLSHGRYMPHQSHSPFNHLVNMWYRIQNIKTVNGIQYFPTSCCFLPLKHTFSQFSQAPSVYVLALMWRDQISYPYKTTPKIIIIYTFIHMCVEWRPEGKIFRTEQKQEFDEFDFLLPYKPEYKATPYFSNRKTENKKFWEELIAYFPLIRHGPHRKQRLQQIFVARERPYQIVT
jgi:hypothetical protein